jgi:hypothetical protein
MKINFNTRQSISRELGSGAQKLPRNQWLIKVAQEIAQQMDIQFGPGVYGDLCTIKGVKITRDYLKQQGFDVSFWSLGESYGLDFADSCPMLIEMKLKDYGI